jgi:uncharacterized protein with PIN domain
MKSNRKCPVCSELMTPHAGVTSRERGATKLKISDADFFSCPTCRAMYNVCDTHGLFAAEAHGRLCPECYPKEVA